ncbi:MAG: acetyl-CoA C-acetyltransferase [Deltaproteobacteria bacterium]|nr:acetyl-CoA C-acetyltransferase [Deltaproteobacteria bacterium]
MRNAVIVSYARTPIGEFNGALATTPADVLGGIIMAELIRRAGVEASLVDEVIFGNVLPHGLGQNPARQAVLKGGLPVGTSALTVNKVCGSGLKAIMLAAQAIQVGDADVVLAGGMENMNLAPYFMPKARTGARMGHTQLLDAMVHDGLWDLPNDVHMGTTAEWVTEKFGVTREDMDAFSARSYEKALAAQAAGLFDAEICPVSIPQRKGAPKVFSVDETPRPTPIDVLSKLRPAFKRDGTVTAGNASKISDGAAGVMVMAEEVALAHGLTPLFRIGAQVAAGVDPKDVLVAPIASIPKLLKKAGLTEADVHLHEINEAFATSSVAINRALNIDEAKVNVHGGSIALGHPIGASGARILTTLLSALTARDQSVGMATLCLGGGEAVSMLVERV